MFHSIAKWVFVVLAFQMISLAEASESSILITASQQPSIVKLNQSVQIHGSIEAYQTKSASYGPLQAKDKLRSIRTFFPDYLHEVTSETHFSANQQSFDFQGTASLGASQFIIIAGELTGEIRHYQEILAKLENHLRRINLKIAKHVNQPTGSAYLKALRKKAVLQESISSINAYLQSHYPTLAETRFPLQVENFTSADQWISNQVEDLSVSIRTVPGNVFQGTNATLFAHLHSLKKDQDKITLRYYLDQQLIDEKKNITVSPNGIDTAYPFTSLQASETFQIKIYRGKEGAVTEKNLLGFLPSPIHFIADPIAPVLNPNTIQAFAVGPYTKQLTDLHLEISDELGRINPASIHLNLLQVNHLTPIPLNFQIEKDPVYEKYTLTSEAPTLSDGAYVLSLDASDFAGNAMTPFVRHFILDQTAPVIHYQLNTDQLTYHDPNFNLPITISDTSPTQTEIKLNGVLVSTKTSTQFTESLTLQEGSNQIVITATDAAGNQSSVSLPSITYESTPPVILPPDPSTLAPALPSHQLTSTLDQVRFLYTGSNPIQTGVNELSISKNRAAIIRGRVLNKNNTPLGGATVTVLNHPEFGQTLSRADGYYDLVVNGGSILAVNITMDGFLPVQRQVNVPWKNFALANDAVLIPLDQKSTLVQLNSSTTLAQVHQGTRTTDSDGARGATILIPPGTTAKISHQDGSFTDVSALHIRATEYTIGANGFQSMPAELPPYTGYTYAAEFSADEVTEPLDEVQFSQPVYVYVDNFINFPVGDGVPAGYYERKTSRWVPSTNGRVIKILSIANGVASVSVDATGNAASASTLSALGFTSAELTKLATLYTAGQTFWRVPIAHFTPWDFNWATKGAFVTNSNLYPANSSPLVEDYLLEDPSLVCHQSTIQLENRVFNEELALPGTDMSLVYSSDRVAGYSASRVLRIPLTGATIPNELQSIELTVTIAGQLFTQTFSPSTNLSYRYTWDGKDVYGRNQVGATPIFVKIAYVYQAGYLRVPGGGTTASATFNQIPEDYALSYDLIPARQETKLNTQYTSYLNVAPFDSSAISNWSLSEHHFYDPVGKVLYLGSGERIAGDDLSKIVAPFLGNGSNGFPTANSDATQTAFSQPEDLSVSADGKVYVGGRNGLGYVDLDGSFKVPNYFPTNPPDYVGNVPAISVVTQGTDNLVYFSSVEYSSRIFRINADHSVTWIAGNGNFLGISADGNAKSVSVNAAAIAAAQDGNIYILDSRANSNGSAIINRVKAINPAGNITTLAGQGTQTPREGLYASSCVFAGSHASLSIAPDQTLYITNDTGVFQIQADGKLHQVVGGNVQVLNLATDGQLATEAFVSIRSMKVDRNGDLYFMDLRSNKVFKVGTDQKLHAVVGNGVQGDSGDYGIALNASVTFPQSFATDQNGVFYFADQGTNKVKQIKGAFSTLQQNRYVVSSKDKSEVYIFDETGKHLETRDSKKGVLLRSFAYDGNGRLASITDQNGNVTTITRDGSTGAPLALTSPFGIATTFSTLADGSLSQVSYADGANYFIGYSGNPLAKGLVTSIRKPKGNTSTFAYDSTGKLTHDGNAGGGFVDLLETALSRGINVDTTSALARSESYEYQSLSNGVIQRSQTDKAGFMTTSQRTPASLQTTTYSTGMNETFTLGADPRFGMASAYTRSFSLNAPSGLSASMTRNRLATLTNKTDLFSLSTETETTVLNGKTSTRVFNASANTLTDTSPEGRVRTLTLDSKGRVAQETIGGITPTVYSYDARGRLSSITQGPRSTTLSYLGSGFLGSMTDPLSRVSSFSYDPVGRVTAQGLPDGRVIGLTYDANGNISSITPPSKPAHGFTFNLIDLISSTIAPSLGFGSTTTTSTYNLDKEPAQVSRPDAKVIQYLYEGDLASEPKTGRLLKVQTSDGNIDYSYFATSPNLKSVRSADLVLSSFNYDGSLLTQSVNSGPVTGSIAYAYNSDFLLSATSVNGASIVNYTYDRDNLLTAAGAESISRNAQNGLITQITLGNVVEQLGYNAFGETTRYQTLYSGSTQFDETLTRNNAGLVTNKVETILGVPHTFDYGYDGVGRLLSVNQDGSLISNYTYDSNGNRLSLVNASGTTSATFDAQDRILTSGTLTFSYTQAGELSKIVDSNGNLTTLFNYDVFSNLKSVTKPDGTLIEYLVDGMNRRVGKKVNGALVKQFVYQNQYQIAAELNSSGNIISRFVYGSKQNIPDLMIRGSNTYKIVSDHLGSPKLVINVSDGSIIQAIDYDEFGQITSNTNPGFIPFGFAGCLYDDDTKLCRFGARDYDASIGRWLSKDPIGFDGGDTNLYGYVFQDPVNGVDLKGLYTVQMGGAYNINWGPVALQGGGGVTFDGKGNIGFYSYNGGLTGIGITTGVGFSYQTSTASNINGLKGISYNSSVHGGLGLGGSLDYFNGYDQYNSPVSGFGFTLGTQVGASACGGFSSTQVVPIIGTGN